MEDKKQRYVGIDVGKRTMEVRIKDGNQFYCWNGKTDAIGRKRLLNLLLPTDRIGIEAGNLAFIIAKQIITEVGSEVLVLNPGDLQIIYKSLKKTDKEDALKLSRMVEKFDNEELPIVNIPSEEEMLNRALVSQIIFFKELRIKLINRLHSVYLKSGIVHLKKANLKTRKNRERAKELLEQEIFIKEALFLEKMILDAENNIEELNEQKSKALQKDENTKYLMSIPGVGPELALAFIAYIGDASRFSKASQVSNYVGLVPRVDISGETIKYGHITKKGCKQIRRVAVQAAWALVRSIWGGALQKKYYEISERRGKGVAIVAIARRLIELMWTIVTKKSYYWYMPKENREKKLKLYKIGIMAA